MLRAACATVQASCPRLAAAEIAFRLSQSLVSADLVFFFGAGPLYPTEHVGALLEEALLGTLGPKTRVPVTIGAVGPCSSSFGIMGEYDAHDGSPALSALGLSLPHRSPTRFAVFGDDTTRSIQDPLGGLRRVGRRCGRGADAEWASWGNLATRPLGRAPDVLCLIAGDGGGEPTAGVVRRLGLLLPGSSTAGGVAGGGAELQGPGGARFASTLGLIIDGCDSGGGDGRPSRLRMSAVACPGPTPFGPAYTVTEAAPARGGGGTFVLGLDGQPMAAVWPEVGLRARTSCPSRRVSLFPNPQHVTPPPPSFSYLFSRHAPAAGH